MQPRSSGFNGSGKALNNEGWEPLARCPPASCALARGGKPSLTSSGWTILGAILYASQEISSGSEPPPPTVVTLMLDLTLAVPPLLSHCPFLVPIS